MKGIGAINERWSMKVSNRINIDKKSITNQANMELGFPNELLCTFAPSEDALMSSIEESNNKESPMSIV